MTDQYYDLYTAIWAQAVSDDIVGLVKHLSDIGIDTAYKTYNKLARNKPAGKMDPKFNRINIDIKGYSEMKARELEPRIKTLVFQEAQEWPDNKQLSSIDPEYQEKLKMLEEEIRVFAIKRMSANWRKL